MEREEKSVQTGPSEREEAAVQHLRVLDRNELSVRSGELRGRVALSLTTAAVALGLVNFTGSWLGLLPLLVVPYFMWKMVRAQKELGILEDADDL